jgi:hypothetical protein
MSKLSSIEFKVTWKANIEEFWIKYFHLICHLILTKINCITLKIRSKADFKSKSQNIWQQMIMLSRTVMQRICAWHKIRTLSGRLSLMRNVQLMRKNKRYIPCVPHENNCKKIDSHDISETDSSIIIIRNACVLTSASRLFIFSSRGHDRHSSEQNNRKLINLHNNGEDSKHAHGFADF